MSSSDVRAGSAEPLDFMARFAALVPPPRVHQTRYHGEFAADSVLRAAVTPSSPGQGSSDKVAQPGEESRATMSRHVSQRSRARRRFPAPVLIDEVQYAPSLLTEIKIQVDRKQQNGALPETHAAQPDSGIPGRTGGWTSTAYSTICGPAPIRE